MKEAKQDKKYPVYRDKYSSPAYPKKEIRPAEFDPNTADSALPQPRLASLDGGQYSAIPQKARQIPASGRLRKIYGLTEEQYRTLQPYIRIAETPVLQDTSRILVVQATTPYDTLMKYPPALSSTLIRRILPNLKRFRGSEAGLPDRL